ncbi:MAG: EF-P lysine aminoacylase GenX [Hyphomonadaceae bacterium]|nr:EF-P lysine aminoacylase GenX [Hyphomonadaceae bacterium]
MNTPPRPASPPIASWWTPSRHADRRGFLLSRARILAAIRAWFADQGFLEADTGALVQSPGAETHIDAFAADGRYLHTSPEFAMKKLLAAGEQKIFFLGKAYRKGESGPLHAPEFTLLEWYRADAPYERIMDDCLALLRLAADAAGAREFRWRDRTCDPFASAQRLTIAEAFANFAPPSPPGEGVGGGVRLSAAGSRRPTSPNNPDTEQHPAPYPLPSRGVGAALSSDEFSARLVTHVEPQLGIGAPTLLTEYPISEAALARPCAHDPSVAERFELYACGVELANAFGELTDPVEQRRRLIAAMDEKERRYGLRWPIDEDFLAALAHMPEASGCALGVDRLVMLAAGATHIDQVLWNPPQ